MEMKIHNQASQEEIRRTKHTLNQTQVCHSNIMYVALSESVCMA